MSDIIDIVVQETIDLVDITVNPNIIEVNVTRTSGGGGGIPTLQQVLDNNHDLVDGNFFAGTGAGDTNTGNTVIAIGEGAAGGNSGIIVNALGELAAQSNLGTEINAFGNLAAFLNEGNYVNGLGANAATGNLGDYVNAFGSGAGSENTFNHVQLLGQGAQADEDGQTVLSKDGAIMARISTTDLTESRKYTLQDADGTLAFLSDITGGGTVTSVGLTMPSAFIVTNSPITSSGDIAVTGAGAVSQYVRGDGSLANFPTSSGGGSSLSFYLNGSVSQGTFGGVAFREMDRTPILGAGTDFTINANGYIQSFITDAGVPNLLEIPAGNWNFETYFSASSNGGSPSFYVELYKWDGTTLSLIASSSANPEFITGGTNTDLYVSALAVPQTTLLATDRLAVRIYVTHSGRTIKLHTEDSNLSQVITTFSTGLTALNGLTAQVQNLATGTSGTDFGIVSSASTHTFNLPNASAANRGLLTSSDWSTFNSKQNDLKTFNRTQGIYFFEEFMGNQGGGITTNFAGLITTQTGAGANCITTGTITNRTNQQGVARAQTGTILTGQAGFIYGSNFIRGLGTVSIETYANVETLSTLTERFFTFFGHIGAANYQNPINGIFFTYDEGGVVAFGAGNAPSPNWKCVAVNSLTRTFFTSSVPVVAGQWYKLRIDLNAAGTQASFYIDGNLITTLTTNIPATSTAMGVHSLIVKTIGTTARAMQTDYFMYEEIFTNPR